MDTRSSTDTEQKGHDGNVLIDGARDPNLVSCVERLRELGLFSVLQGSHWAGQKQAAPKWKAGET